MDVIALSQSTDVDSIVWVSQYVFETSPAVHEALNWVMSIFLPLHSTSRDIHIPTVDQHPDKRRKQLLHEPSPSGYAITMTQALKYNY